MYILSAFADEAASDLAGQIAALKRNNISLIELRSVDGKNIMEHTLDEVRRIKKQLDENGIKLSALGSPIGKVMLSEFDEHIKTFRKALEIAEILDTDKIRMFSFFMTDGYSEKRGEVMEKLSVLKEMADKAGIMCCHENEKGIYGNIAKRNLDVLQTVGMRAVFDPANYIQCGEKPDEIFESLAPYVEYIHIKDALSADGDVVPAGMGDGGIAGILQSFKSDRNIVLSIEPHLSVFSGLNKLQNEELKNKYVYNSNTESFDAAVAALKNILEEIK